MNKIINRSFPRERLRSQHGIGVPQGLQDVEHDGEQRTAEVQPQGSPEQSLLAKALLVVLEDRQAQRQTGTDTCNEGMN